MSEINDKRVISDFRNITFSNYKKNVAKKELTKTLYESKVEDSCYWSSELICAGHFSDLWDIIIIFTSRFINIGNPKLPIYLDLIFKNLKYLLVVEKLQSHEYKGPHKSYKIYHSPLAQ